MIDNKYKDILKACKSDFTCGNYIYEKSNDVCERCRTKDMC